MKKTYLLLYILLMTLFLSLDKGSISLAAEAFGEYEGEAYCQVDKGIPGFTAAEKRKDYAFENYSKLDELGRCGVAYVNVCRELMPEESRGRIGFIRPSGWHTVKYNGLIDGNYLYNRCHLVGYQLAGENANARNLITGTRYLNIEGMLPFEDQVADYVNHTGNHVLYRVTPVFAGDELVARGVQMEAWSVEDGGKGICFNVYCYNVQPGISIDYATGDSRISPDKTSKTQGLKDKKKKATSSPGSAAAGGNSLSKDDIQTEKTDKNNSAQTGDKKQSCDYIANKNTKKFHYPGCSSVKDMADHNKLSFSGTGEDLMDAGYVPCKRCNP